MSTTFQLKRTYFPTGTNGIITLNSAHVSFSIELPWLNNQPRVSCIPEGTYELIRYVSPKHGTVLLVKDVPNRSMIEIHAANYATGITNAGGSGQATQAKQAELLGCIAPVTELDKQNPGVGWASRDALKKVTSIAFAAFKSGQKVYLTITS